MKLIEEAEFVQRREVVYYGITFMVDVNHNFMACDADGELYSFYATPITDESGGWFVSTESDENAPENINTAEYVALVDLEGEDWTQTLVSI